MAEDRELLELAAKAAGIDLQPDPYSGLMWVREKPEDRSGLVWSPLTSSGDALELLVRCGLKLNICVGGECVQVGGIGTYVEIDFDNDPLAATRRAIVRAAAEIGRKSNG